MSLVSDIITDAYRRGNLVAVGAAPTAAEQTEALRYLNRIVKSVLGNEVGDQLFSVPIGTSEIIRPANYPQWGQDPGGDWVVPKNARVNANLTEALTIYLHPAPADGTRFAVSDGAGTLGTYNLTVMGNGKSIEDANSVVLSTSGLDREWIYRADLGNWQRVSPLISSDTFPFPEEFDDYFISLLMLTINPSHGSQIDAQSQQLMMRSKSQLRARYRQPTAVRQPEALRRISPVDGYVAMPQFGDSPDSIG